MIGIQSISTYIPEKRINNLLRAEILGVSKEQIKEKIGFFTIAQMEKDQSVLDLASQAFNNLLENNNIQSKNIDVLIVIGQNPDRNIPHLSAELHGRFGLGKHCACFDLGLGCSGYVYGLSVITAFMNANNMQNGVLLTCDPYSKIVDQNDKATALIFGDAATATLINNTPIYTFGKFIFTTDGSGAESISCNDNKLFMNGRAVFNFAATQVPEIINKTLDVNNCESKDIDKYLIHQGSRYIVETIADRITVGYDKVPFMAKDYGNTVSSSIPIMLAEVISEQNNKKNLLCGFGLGLSIASTVIVRKE